MKNFLLKIVLFFILLVLLFVGLYAYTNYIFNRDSMQLFSTENNLVLGDSHAQKGFATSQYPNAINMGGTSEALIYSFYKLQLVSSKQKIDTLFLSVSFHTFSDYYDPIIFRHDLMKRYFLTQSIDGQYQLLSQADDPLGFLHKTVAEYLRYPNNEKLRKEWMGGYYNPYKNCSIDSTIVRRRISQQYFSNHKERGFSNSNTLYFEKIVQFCRDHQIALIVLNIPMHDYYIQQIPDRFKSYFYDLMAKERVALYEYEDFKRKDSYFIPDGDHLSKEGAEFYTKSLYNYLKKKI